MRLVSADSRSVCCLPASVARKRRVVMAPWPMSNRQAGKTSWSQTAPEDNSTNCDPSKPTKSAAVSQALAAAPSLGKPTTTYSPTSSMAPRTARPPHRGSAMKWPPRMLEVMCAMVSAGDIDAETGVANAPPTPAAVAPMITILSAYLLAGMAPEITS